MPPCGGGVPGRRSIPVSEPSDVAQAARDREQSPGDGGRREPEPQRLCQVRALVTSGGGEEEKRRVVVGLVLLLGQNRCKSKEVEY